MTAYNLMTSSRDGCFHWIKDSLTEDELQVFKCTGKAPCYQ